MLENRKYLIPCLVLKYGAVIAIETVHTPLKPLGEGRSKAKHRQHLTLILKRTFLGITQIGSAKCGMILSFSLFGVGPKQHQTVFEQMLIIENILPFKYQ